MVHLCNKQEITSKAVKSQGGATHSTTADVPHRRHLRHRHIFATVSGACKTAPRYSGVIQSPAPMTPPHAVTHAGCHHTSTRSEVPHRTCMHAAGLGQFCPVAAAYNQRSGPR